MFILNLYMKIRPCQAIVLYLLRSGKQSVLKSALNKKPNLFWALGEPMSIINNQTSPITQYYSLEMQI